jgi:hypothetical protein
LEFSFAISALTLAPAARSTNLENQYFA